MVVTTYLGWMVHSFILNLWQPKHCGVFLCILGQKDHYFAADAMIFEYSRLIF